MADFRVKSVIFHTLDWLPRLPQARSQRPHYSRMAELPMNSATVELGRMPTSELPYYSTPEQVRQILAAMPTGQPWLFARLTG